MKVSDLTGRELDYWVARAEGLSVCVSGVSMWVVLNSQVAFLGGDHVPQWSPSTAWAQGGPIIERADIVHQRHLPKGSGYSAYVCDENTVEFGPTMLIAAMRAYVASKFGEEVEAMEA